MVSGLERKGWERGSEERESRARRVFEADGKHRGGFVSSFGEVTLGEAKIWKETAALSRSERF